MSIEIDFTEVIKNSFKETFDNCDFLTALTEDIRKDNAEWWIERIVTPVKDELIKTIKEDKEFRRDLAYQLIDCNDLEYYARDYLKVQLDKLLEERIVKLMDKIKIEINE